jgi:hypothetical protein
MVVVSVYDAHMTTTMSITARLVPNVDEHAMNLPGSWFITHPLGGPAGDTYTEVVIHQGERYPESMRDDAVRFVATELYGSRWAFHYRPEQFDDAIGRYGLRRRERVFVTEIRAW